MFQADACGPLHICEAERFLSAETTKVSEKSKKTFYESSWDLNPRAFLSKERGLTKLRHPSKLFGKKFDQKPFSKNTLPHFPLKDYKSTFGMSDLVKFFVEAGKLKKLKRRGWIQHGIKDAESVADHS